MKRAFIFLAGIALLASCAKESVEAPQPESEKVPLNITIQTKAGGSGDTGSYHDIKSVRIVVFKNTGEPSTDLTVLNEYYSFGFDVDDQEDKRYTVTVKPTLELDLNTNLYYVYAILNEDGYTLTDSKVLSDELEEVASRSGMITLLQAKATYPTDGVKVAPYCLMSACKTVDFSGGRDLPIEVHFGMYGSDAANPSPLDRTMAQITVESIKSNANATNAAELSKVFVLDVDLVNVPSGIAWGVDNSGNPIAGSTTGGTDATSLPIGAAFDPEDGTTPYYKRIWGGNVYKQVAVNVNCEQRMTANYYRTAATGNSAWGFYDDRDGAIPITPWTYQGTLTEPTAPTPVVAKPFGFPTFEGDKPANYKWKYKKSKYVTDKHGVTTWNKNEDKEVMLSAHEGDSDAAYRAAYNDYVSSLPNAGNDKNPDFVTLAEAEAYNTYWPLKEQYDAELAAYQAELTSVYAAAVTGRKSIDAKYASGNSVDNLITDLGNIFQKETYYSVNKHTVTSVKNPQPTSYVTYCTGDGWTVNLGDSYYVPENISTSFDNATTTCIKVTLAVAAPEITVPTGIDVTKLPEATGITGGTFTYYFDHYYQTEQTKNDPSVRTKQTFELKQTTNDPKIKKTNIGGDGKYGKPQEVNFSIATLFELDGHIVDADDETIECTAATTNNKYHVYIDGESFWRTGTGLTGTVTVDAEQEGATFSWNIPAADKTSTTDFMEVKEFYIPVNNAQFDSDYSVRRNTKYTVKLTVGDSTYAGFATTPSSVPTVSKELAGLSITADVTAEKLIEDEN